MTIWISPSPNTPDQIISSLVETARLELCVSNKGDRKLYILQILDCGIEWRMCFLMCIRHVDYLGLLKLKITQLEVLHLLMHYLNVCVESVWASLHTLIIFYHLYIYLTYQFLSVWTSLSSCYISFRKCFHCDKPAVWHCGIVFL